MQMKDAQVQGSQMLLRSALSYDSAARASNDKKAFVKATELLIENMLESLTKRSEIAMLHGGHGIGRTTSVSVVDSTNSTVTFSLASWAAGIWAGTEGAKINFYNGSSLVSSGVDSVFVVKSVDVDARQIVVTGTSNGSTALVALTATPLDAYFKGSYGNEMAGLRKIITNSGTLFNINAADYNLWKGNNVVVSGKLTMGKVLSAVSKAVQRGLNEKVVVLVNPDTWAGLNSDLAALKRFDQSYKSSKGENGVESIVYHGQNGEIEIISHNLVKAGEAFIFPPKRLKRIGAQEISFQTPGREGEIFLHLPNNAGFEMRCYSDQAIFVETPARCVYLSGFEN